MRKEFREFLKRPDVKELLAKNEIHHDSSIGLWFPTSDFDNLNVRAILRETPDNFHKEMKEFLNNVAE